MALSPNKLKHLQPGDGMLLGAALVTVHTPGAAMLMAKLGVGYLEVDGTAMSPSAASSISLMGRALGLPVIQRVHGFHRAYFGPALEGGARGLSVPGVSNLAEAQEVVMGSRYAPLGMRGTFEPSPHNDYEDDPQDLAGLNRDMHVTLRLSPHMPAGEVGAIAALDGIDAIEFEGATPKDYAGPLAAATAAVTASDALLSAQACCVQDLSELARAGVQLLRYADDADLLASYFSEELSHFRREITRAREVA
jgi:2-keto-3-deoxy-L-rhamnonate aldolase RhmA